MRRLWIFLVIFALVGAAGLAWLGWHGLRDWQASRERCDIPASITSPRMPANDAPGGGGILVVEQGFTDGVNGETSLGAILRNTSGLVAYRTTITYRVYNKQHQLTSVNDMGQQIPFLLPGQDIGIGTTVAASGPVTSFAVVIQTTQWVPPNTLGKHFDIAAASDPHTTRNAKIAWVAGITFTDTFTGCRDLVVNSVTTIFRDRSGAIIGGSNDLPYAASQACQRGHHTMSLEAVIAPVQADDGRTSIYPYCDIAAPPNGSP